VYFVSLCVQFETFKSECVAVVIFKVLYLAYLQKPFIQNKYKSLILYVISLQLLSFDIGENILSLKLGFVLLCFTKSPNMIIQQVA
jgi:hypothetical protein